MKIENNKEPPRIADLSAFRTQTHKKQALKRQRIALYSSILFLLAAFLVAYTEAYVITIAPLIVCLFATVTSVFVLMVLST